MSDSSKPLVSFIILTRNRHDQLVRAIASIAAQQYANTETIVVDNGSSDGTDEILRQRYPAVKRLRLEGNLGPSVGRNRGIQASAGEFVIFLDDDCYLVDVDSTETVVNNFRADPSCGAIAFRIYDPVKNDHTYEVGGTGRRGTAVETVRFCSGGFAARREALEKTRGFYEPYFMGHEDTDLSLRIMIAGWRLMLRGDVEVYHPSIDSNAPRNYQREIYFNVRNSLWLAMRILPYRKWLSLLVPKIYRSFTLAYRSWNLRLFMRGLTDGLRGLGRCLDERRPLSRDIIRRSRRVGLSLWA